MTIILIIFTVVISYFAFNNANLYSKSLFNAYKIIQTKEYPRLISHGFIHANWNHLILNMLVLYFFGRNVELYFTHYFGNTANIYFIVFYLSAIIVSSVVDLVKYKDSIYYNEVGSSGATSAIVFASILFAPYSKIFFMYFLPIPGIVFGVAYLIYSYVMSKKNIDNIAHTAHFCGAIYGFVFPILLKFDLFKIFISKIFSIY
jgi:membrane associated rhomboid family serine protease